MEDTHNMNPALDQLKIYLAGKIVDARDARVSVFDAGFQSGDAVWEGLRLYNGTVFSIDEHLSRLEESAKALCLRLPLDKSGIRDAVYQTLEANNFTDGAHLRLMVTRGTRSTSGMDPKNAPDVGTLIIIAESKPVDDQPAPQRLRTSSIRRPSAATLDPSIHHSNQLNSILARLEVRNDPGVDAALMLDMDGNVAEADTANIFLVKGNSVYTPYATACLSGLTRRLVLKLAADAGFDSQERTLGLFDFYGADEVFITGTVCELVPIVAIDGRPIGLGEPGPVHQALLRAYRGYINDASAANRQEDVA